MNGSAGSIKEQAMSRVSPEAMRIAVWAWAAIGVIVLIAVLAWAFAWTASISVPLLLALLLGFLFGPWVTWLERHRIPRSLGAALVLLGLVLVFVGLIVLVVVSLAGNLGDVGQSIDQGVEEVEAWIVSLDIDPETAESVTASVTKVVPSVAVGAASTVTSGLASTVATIVMIVIALYICYLMLVDSGTILDWMGAHLGVPKAVGDEIVQDAANATRAYFKGATLLGIVTGVATTIGLFLVGAPLAILIGIITAVLSYIPYIGAFIAGAFAVVVAFGAGGWELALWALLVVLFVQGVLQTFVQAPLMGNALEMNPVAVFVVTMLGGVVAGALGAMLGAPLLSAVLSINRTLRDAKEKGKGNQSPAGPAAAAVPDG
jgi:predicted PurR-regulated permease PerM